MTLLQCFVYISDFRVLCRSGGARESLVTGTSDKYDHRGKAVVIRLAVNRTITAQTKAAETDIILKNSLSGQLSG